MSFFSAASDLRRLRLCVLGVTCLATMASVTLAQQPAATQPAAVPAIALDEAIARARANEPTFAAAVATAKKTAKPFGAAGARRITPI